jgi:pimeloyl-ACP methyl ester carboxylesterase
VIRHNVPVVTEMMLPVNGVELCAEVFGDRSDPAVLLLGGAACSMDWWDAEFCRRLAAGGRYVIRFDYRDTGRSTSFPAGEPPYSQVDLAHDALGVLDALQIHKAHLVGLSMGGVLAQRIAVSRPHRLLSLTLMSTTAGDPSPDTSDSSSSDSSFSEEEVPEPAPDWANRRVAVDRLTEAVRALGGAFTPDEPQVRRFAERVFERTTDMAASQTNHYMVEPGPPIRDRLGEIKVPTLILHGTQDPVFDRSHPEALAAAIPGARGVWLEGVGHEYPPNAVWPEVLKEILTQGN